ncbi:hypothetical protein D3C85_1159280 [compost metagenome]
MALADFDETLWRQAQHRAAIGQALEAGKRRRAGGAQRAVGGPGVALALRAEALGEVDLIAVAGLDIVLDALQRVAILISAQVGAHRCFQCERLDRLDPGLAEQGDQPLPLAVDQRRVKHQLTGLELVIADQGPGIEPETRIRQLQVVLRQARQMLQVTTEVIAQVADQAAGERQVKRQRGFTQPCQVVAQALQEIAAAFVRQYGQLFQRPGAEQVITTAIGSRPTTVEQYGTGGMTNRREVVGGIGAIGERVYGTGQHGRGGSAIEAGWRL